MIKYFPKREDVEGFTNSIKSIKQRLLNDLGKTEATIEPLIKPTITIHRPRVGVGHWANRGYEEYKDAA